MVDQATGWEARTDETDDSVLWVEFDEFPLSYM